MQYSRFRLPEHLTVASREARVPARYGSAYAGLCAKPPRIMLATTWQRAVADAALLLEDIGREASQLRWTAEDLFGPQGIVWELKGRRVFSIVREGLWLDNGRWVDRPGQRGKCDAQR